MNLQLIGVKKKLEDRKHEIIKNSLLKTFQNMGKELNTQVGNDI